LTGKLVVDKCITELCVFDFVKDGPEQLPLLAEIAPGVTIDQVKEATGFEFCVAIHYRSCWTSEVVLAFHLMLLFA